MCFCVELAEPRSVALAFLKMVAFLLRFYVKHINARALSMYAKHNPLLSIESIGDIVAGRSVPHLRRYRFFFPPAILRFGIRSRRFFDFFRLRHVEYRPPVSMVLRRCLLESVLWNFWQATGVRHNVFFQLVTLIFLLIEIKTSLVRLCRPCCCTICYRCYHDNNHTYWICWRTGNKVEGNACNQKLKIGCQYYNVVLSEVLLGVGDLDCSISALTADRCWMVRFFHRSYTEKKRYP